MPTTPPSSGARFRRGRGWIVAGALLLAAVTPTVAAARPPRGRIAQAGVACANSSLMPSAHDTAAVSSAIVCLINAVRAQYGLDPLRPNRALNASAMGHSRDMMAHDYFGHNSLGGRTPAQRMERMGAPCADGCVLGENIAWVTGSYSTPEAIVQAWMNSSGHRANILDPVFRYEGLGVAEGAPGDADGQTATTVTQDFDS